MNHHLESWGDISFLLIRYLCFCCEHYPPSASSVPGTTRRLGGICHFAFVFYLTPLGVVVLASEELKSENYLGEFFASGKHGDYQYHLSFFVTDCQFFYFLCELCLSSVTNLDYALHVISIPHHFLSSFLTLGND